MISIIVPVYNSYKYLDFCLQSIQNQKYQDWECILINDGSSDGSGEICEKWANIDSRFRVVHQDNSGVSKARNNGIRKAKGDFIAFIDSDDWINDDYLSNLVTNNNDIDLVLSGLIDQYGDRDAIINKPMREGVFRIERASAYILEDLLNKNLLYGPVVKLYKKKIIHKHNIYFPEDCSLGEDLVFNFKYLEYVKFFKTVPIASYNYRKDSQDSLFKKIHYNQFKTDYNHWKIRYNYFLTHDLLTDNSLSKFMSLLWGLIYDGIFRYESLNYPSIKYLKFLNEIPEIDILKNYTNIFNCSKWIKNTILMRNYILFFLYFSCKRLTRKRLNS